MVLRQPVTMQIQNLDLALPSLSHFLFPLGPCVLYVDMLFVSLVWCAGWA
jgi:hypothetical protein